MLKHLIAGVIVSLALSGCNTGGGGGNQNPQPAAPQASSVFGVWSSHVDTGENAAIHTTVDIRSESMLITKVCTQGELNAEVSAEAPIHIEGDQIHILQAVNQLGNNEQLPCNLEIPAATATFERSGNELKVNFENNALAFTYVRANEFSTAGN